MKEGFRMKRLMKYHLHMILCAILLFSGCQKSQVVEAPTVSSEQQKEEKPAKKPTKKKTKKKKTEKKEATVTEPQTETQSVETEALEPETETETEASTEELVATEDTFDYVALGNSVTCNEIQDGLWWGNWGMAATSEEKDYVHIVSAWLGGQSRRPVTTTVVDLKDWELAQDRNALLPGFETYFNEHTDLITIQTGENITNFKETLGSDYVNLIGTIREKAPNAQILVLGEVLWPSADIEAAKQTACASYGGTFVDMSPFLNGYEGLYKSAVGAGVSGADGGGHTISSEEVAAHPNDDGMACIAQQVINCITVKNE